MIHIHHPPRKAKRNVGPLGALSKRGREAIESFWDFASFVTNSLVFLLIGIQLENERILSQWQVVLTAIGVVLVGRGLAVYGSGALVWPTPWRVPWQHQHLLFWGGLRGALALALALGLPSDMPLRHVVIAATFGVVAFSVIVQGLSLSPLLHALGEHRAGHGKPSC